VDFLGAMTTFVRVVDAGNLSKAARALGVTPAAVSRQLSTLEEELGAPLLVRTTRQVALTEEGRRFYDHAERTIAEADEARTSVRPDRAFAGQLTVSIPTALGLGLLDRTVADLVTKHPGLRVDLRLEDQPVDLVADGVDIAVRAGLLPPDTTTLVAQPLAAGERVVVAAPAYLKRHGEPKTPAALSSHEALIHLHAGAGVGVWTLHQPGNSVTVEVRGPLRTNALHAIRNAALSGAGIALLPLFLVDADVRARRLRVLSLGGFRPAGQRVYALVRTEARSRARVRAFLEHAREELSRAIGPI
jgi:DNA-binding transcriptional LysR family regulator